MSLLFEVSFPLGLVLSWEESVGIIAKDEPGWAESVERVRSGAVLQEGLGKLVGVEGVLRSQVSCGESFGCLDVGDLLGGLGHHGRDCGISCARSVEDFLA